MFEIVFISVSPGLSVKTYLQKLIDVASWNTNIHKKKGNCFSIFRNKTKTKLITNVIKIIPIISDKPAMAWLKKPRLDNANSSVKTRSWIE